MSTISRIREWAYQKKLLKPVELPAYVVSVGNISMGGTGKSAFVMLLVEWAAQRKIPTLVLSRGYKRKASGLCILKPGEALPDAAEMGDEPWMIKHRVPSVSMLVHGDRARMASRHWKEFGGIRLVVLDDAFQHWRCARDLDVLMIDATESLDQNALPFGRLRETVRSARRADLIVITRADAVSAEVLERLEIRLRNASVPRTQPVWKRLSHTAPWIVSAEYKFTGFRDARTGEIAEPESDREYLLVSGIAKPDHLRTVVKQAGLRAVEEIYFPDHHRLSDADVKQITTALANLRHGALLITEKDWARWRALFAGKLEGFVICVDFSFRSSGSEALSGFFAEVAKGTGCSTLP